MKAQDWLFDIIHAMSTQEKTFFVKYCSLFSGGSTGYMALYEALEKMPVFDEAKVKKTLQGRIPESRLPATRNYLKNMLLRAMQLAGSEPSDDIELNAMLFNVAFYRRKGLVTLCEKEIAAAKKFVQQRELFTRFHEVARWERMLIPTVGTIGEELMARVEEIIGEERLNFAKLETDAEYHLRAIRLSKIVQRSGRSLAERIEDSEEFRAFCRDPYYTDESKAITIASKIAYCNLQFVVAYQLKDPERVQYFLDRRLALMESNKAYLENNLQTYISTLYNHVVFTALKKDAGLFVPLIEKFTAIPQRFKKRISKFQAELVQAQTIHAWLDFHTLTGNFEAIVKMDIRFPGMYSGSNYYLAFYYACCQKAATAYFATGDFKSALKFLNRVIQDAEAKSFPERLMHCRILNLMLHYELNNDAVIESGTRAIHYRLKKSEAPAQLEEYLLQFIRALQGRDEPGQYGKLDAIREKVLAIAPPDEDQHNFIVHTWLEAKTKGISFAEAYQKLRAR